MEEKITLNEKEVTKEELAEKLEEVKKKNMEITEVQANVYRTRLLD